MTSMPLISKQTGRRGHSADLLHWPCTDASKAPSTIVLFIPGNPGLPQYYVSFLNRIHQDLSSTSTTIYALGHLGHSPQHEPRRWTNRGTATLKDQVEHKVDFVDKLKEEYDLGSGEGQTRLMLIGHSIGSWISCEVLKARPDLIHSIFLLFPTVSHMKLTTNGQRLAPLFNSLILPPLALSTTLLSFIPRSVLTTIVSTLSGQSESPESAKVTTSLVSSPGTVVSALSMAADEMREVTSLDEECLKRYGDRMYWYWAEGDTDGWVKDESVEEIEKVLDDAGIQKKDRRWRCEKGMKHAFVLRDDHADELAGMVSEWIQKAFGSTVQASRG